MKAMILCAGQGTRMLPLTENCPKALLKVRGKPLLAYHLAALKAAQIDEVIINLATHGEQIKAYCGAGEQFGLSIRYSYEPDNGYETAGGIIHALPLLGEDSFLVVNCDVFTDYPYHRLTQVQAALAHLVLVDNPSHNLAGDFSFQHQRIGCAASNRLTFTGIAVYHPDLFVGLPSARIRLAQVFQQALDDNQVSAEHYSGYWLDVGTPLRLQQATNLAAKLNSAHQADVNEYERLPDPRRGSH